MNTMTVHAQGRCEEAYNLFYQVETILTAPTINYVKLQNTSGRLRNTIRQANKTEREKLTKITSPILQQAHKEIQSHQSELKTQTRWLDLGFDEDFISTHPYFVDFMLESGIAYSIAGLKNTFGAQNTLHEIRKNEEGEPCVLVEGVFRPWNEIKDKFTARKEYDVFVSKNNESERWTYTDQGITKQDIYEFTEPSPICTLSETEYTTVCNHAKKFYSEKNPDPKPHELKDAVIQIATSVGVACRGQTPFVQNVAKKLASHYGIRIITKEGKVYSFGYRRDFGELDHVETKTTFASVKGVMAMNDFDELRPHKGRYVTSIAISSTDADKIMKEIIGQRGGSFDMLHHNCVEKVAQCLAIADVKVDTVEPFESSITLLAYKFFTHLPYIGQCVKKVKKCACRILNAIPQVVSRPIRFTASIIFFVPHKILTVLKNLFIISLGWTKASPTLQKQSCHCKRKFSYCDLFNPNLSDFNSSRKLLSWQKRKQSTECYIWNGKPLFCLLPQDASRSAQR